MTQTWEQYDDAQERAQAARCLLCGEVLKAGQERAEVVVVVPLGDSETEEHGLAHAQCYLDADDKRVALA